MEVKRLLNDNIEKKVKLYPLSPPVKGSLAHLAYGHLAFIAWRELKRGIDE